MAPAREVYRRVRTGCITCRKRHLKCDERKPQCRHCQIGNRECKYGTTEISTRRSEGDEGFHFDSSHVWLDTPSEVTFVHTVHVNADGNECTTLGTSTPVQSSSDGNDTTFSNSPLSGNTGVPMNEISVENNLTQLPVATPARDTIDFASPHSTTSGGSIDTIIDPIQSLARMRTSGSTIYSPGPIKPLSDPQTARLLQHYINNLACWFDVNDPHRQFETFVPHLALSCPILLHAVLALSACHLSRLDGSYDEFYAAQFHDLCIQGLIPALTNPSTALDNVLPISTVVLRMYEMMSYETDHQRHLKGCSSLFTHNRRNIGFRALKRTAFWTYFREEIMVALATRKPTTIRPRNWKADITWGGDFDYVKTEKMTMLAAEVVDYCFGEDCEDQSNEITRWEELRSEVDTWKETLPDSFQPLYVMEDSSPFPRISYLCTWHIIAMQFYHLVKVLLALHNPLPTRGIEFLRFARVAEAEILKHTVQLCGMTKALGDRYPGALVNAVQPLVICGSTLEKPDEQKELVRMLQRIEEVTAISTSQGIHSLQEAWGLHGGT